MNSVFDLIRKADDNRSFSVSQTVPDSVPQHALFQVNFYDYYFVIAGLPKDSIELLKVLSVKPKIANAYFSDVKVYDMHKDAWDFESAVLTEQQKMLIFRGIEGGCSYSRYMNSSVEAQKITPKMYYPLAQAGAQLRGAVLKFDLTGIPYYITQKGESEEFDPAKCLDDMSKVLQKLEQGDKYTVKGCQLGKMGTYLISGAVISSAAVVIPDHMIFSRIFTETMMQNYEALSHMEGVKKKKADEFLPASIVEEKETIFRAEQVGHIFQSVQKGIVPGQTVTLLVDNKSMETEMNYPKLLGALSSMSLSPPSLAGVPKKATRYYKCRETSGEIWDGDFKNSGNPGWSLKPPDFTKDTCLDLTQLKTVGNETASDLFQKVVTPYIHKIVELNKGDGEVEHPEVTVIFRHELGRLGLELGFVYKNLRVLDPKSGIFACVLSPTSAQNGLFTLSGYCQLIYVWFLHVMQTAENLVKFLSSPGYIYDASPSLEDVAPTASNMALKKVKVNSFDAIKSLGMSEEIKLEENMGRFSFFSAQKVEDSQDAPDPEQDQDETVNTG